MAEKLNIATILVVFVCFLSVATAQNYIGAQCGGTCYSYYFYSYSCNTWCNPCTGTCYNYYYEPETTDGYVWFYAPSDYYCTGTVIYSTYMYCSDCSEASEYNQELYIDECYYNYNYGSSSAVYIWVWIFWVLIFCCVCCCVCGICGVVIYFITRKPKAVLESEMPTSMYYDGAPQAYTTYDPQYQPQATYIYQPSAPASQFYPQYPPQPQLQPQFQVSEGQPQFQPPSYAFPQ